MMSSTGVYDLFLSYAELDDTDAEGPDRKWVTRFEAALRDQLRKAMPDREPNIYFSPLADVASETAEDRAQACIQSQTFLALTSPSYFHSTPAVAGVPGVDSLKRYQRNFHHDPRRIFVAEIEPLLEAQRKSLGPISRDQVYSFHQPIAEHTVHSRLLPESDMGNHRIKELAYKIASKLRALQAARPLPKASTPPLRPILLAQVTDDLGIEYRAVRDYLQGEGCVVLPTSDYPQGGEEFKAAFQKDLKACAMVVQLLSPVVGRTPRDVPHGYSVYQAELAADLGVPILQWPRPPRESDENVVDEKHEVLLSGEGVGKELIVATIGDFKHEVMQRIRQLSVPSKPLESQELKPFGFYIACDKSTRPIALQLDSALRDYTSSSNLYYTIVLPQEFSEQSVREYWDEELRKCHGLLVLHGDSESYWAQTHVGRAAEVRKGIPVQGAVCFGPGTEPPLGKWIPQLDDIVCVDPSGMGWSVEGVLERVPGWVKSHQGTTK